MALSYASVAKGNSSSDSSLSTSTPRVNLGIFKTNLSFDNHPILICRYGDLNCSVEEFLEALSRKKLLAYV